MNKSVYFLIESLHFRWRVNETTRSRLNEAVNNKERGIHYENCNY